MDKNEIIEKLAEISVQIFAIGKLHGISSIEKHTSDLNELTREIANLQSWHTGTPEKGRLVSYHGRELRLSISSREMDETFRMEGLRDPSEGYCGLAGDQAA